MLNGGKMRAVLSISAGGPETLTLGEVAEPMPAAREVRVRVESCAVNYPDVLMIQDRYQHKPPRPFSPGTEVCGTVDAVGTEVRAIRVGDRVFGLTQHGGLAQKVNIQLHNCFRAPRTMPSGEASALLMTYGTAYFALRHRARLQAGETLLVLGAGGGVGLAAVEVGKALGAQVIAVASSQEKVHLAKSRGAGQGVICPRGPLDKDAARVFTDSLKTACREHGADVILDPVGGEYALAALRAIAWEGRYLVTGFTAGIPKMPLNLPLLKSCQIIGISWGAFASREPARNRKYIRELLALYAHGKIRPHIAERFPLERAGEAIARLAQRCAVGKIVVTLS
jgi:NADPH:quinone reductase